MNLKSIMLSERSQAQKNTYHLYNILERQNNSDRKQISGHQVPGDGGGDPLQRAAGNMKCSALVWWWLPEWIHLTKLKMSEFYYMCKFYLNKVN